jgi:hypothetical protein
MVSAWPEPPSAMSAERSAGVGDGMEAFALGGTETPPNRAGEEESGVQVLLASPADFYSERIRGSSAATGRNCRRLVFLEPAAGRGV